MLEPGPESLVVRGEGLERVVVEDTQGLVRGSRSSAAPVDTLELPVRWGEGLHRVEVLGEGERWELALEPPGGASCALVLEGLTGQDPLPLRDGESLEVPLVDGAALWVQARVRSAEPRDLRLSLGDAEERASLEAGQSLVVGRLLDADARLRLEGCGEPLEATLLARSISREEAAAALEIVGVDFPATRDGEADIARPQGRLTLAAPWWRALLRGTRLGVRASDPSVPWGWQAVTVRNHGSHPVNLALQARVLGPEGQADLAFRPRMRDNDDGTGRVAVLLRVPAGGEATASLPFYVDDAKLGEGPWTRELRLAPFGSRDTLVSWEGPLHVDRGSGAASAVLGLTLLAATLGWTLLLVRGRRWLRAARTSELTTIALFGGLTFGVGAVGRLVGMGLAAVLGPFAPLLMGLVDEAFQYTLLATLVALIPRPGVITLVLLVGWLLSGLTLGSFNPTDLLYVGARVVWFEGALWLAGLTRGGAWLEGSRLTRWLRLSLGFSLASGLSVASALAMSIVLYRLFFAPWYVAMMLLGPGFLYVLLAAWLALPFAESLRRIQS